MNKRSHIQTLMFLTLFLVFVMGSFFVMTSEIQVYQNIHESIALQDRLMTPLAYLNTRLKSCDQKEAVELVTIEETLCLKMKEDQHVTYIYYFEGYLRELYAVKDYMPSLDEGEKLFKLDDFKMSNQDQLYHFSVQIGQQSEQISVYMHS